MQASNSSESRAKRAGAQSPAPAETSLFASAREGSKQAIGELLEGCRQYLTLIANRELECELRPKAGASDLVQDSFLEAHRCFEQFSGKSEAELLAWLRGILLHNLKDFTRRFEAAKRRVAQECAWDSGVAAAANGFPRPQELSTASGRLMRQERREALHAALRRLRDDDRRVLLLRYADGCTFAEIGERMQRSPDAARMLWSRALKRLSCKLESLDG